MLHPFLYTKGCTIQVFTTLLTFSDWRQAYRDGASPSELIGQRLALMRLLLLHRYSNLPVQIACAGWQQARSFEELTALIWP